MIEGAATRPASMGVRARMFVYKLECQRKPLVRDELVEYET